MGRNSQSINIDHSSAVSSVADVIAGIEDRVTSGMTDEFTPIKTGFADLDFTIGGGLRLGQLVLVSGHAGVGKTSFAMQMGRNMAASGSAVCLFVCYEHETDYLTQRLISMESVQTGDGTPSDGLRLRDIADLVEKYKFEHRDKQSFIHAVAADARGRTALERISRYGHNFLLMKGSSYSTTVDVLANKVRALRAPGGPAHDKPLVLFVDYLQKIPTESSHVDETARNAEQIEGLKELALDQDIAVVVIVAAQTEGLKAQRLKLEHLLASPLIAYEADIIMIMNEKFDIVDRQYMEYNKHAAQQFHQYVVLSMEKNRMGSDLVDLELKKQLQFCHFRPEARRVRERLIAGRERE
jgi:replicative DNA helicase